MDKDAFYFPHFCNARQDRKIKRVRKELGLEGYGIYFMLLEILREQQEFKFPMEDIDLLADEFGTSEQKLRTVICNYELFQVDKEQNFFSINFIKYLTPYIENKHRKRVAGIKGNLIKHKYATKEELENLTDIEIIEFNENKSLLGLRSLSDTIPNRCASQRKEEESKEEESKEEESKVNKKEIKEELIFEIEKLNISDFLKEKFKEWFEYKKQIKNKPKTMQSFTKMLNQLGKDFKDEKHLADSIDQSIMNEYKGVFPKKELLSNIVQNKNTKEPYFNLK